MQTGELNTPPAAFMDSHLTAQSSTVFRSVHSLIYIFDAESPELVSSDTVYFLKCLRALRDQNPPSASAAAGSASATANGNGISNDEGPTVFVLLHKMDLVPVDQQATKLAEFESEVTKKARDGGYKGALHFWGTSIWNETLYKVRPLLFGAPACQFGIDACSCRHGRSSWRTSCLPSLPFAST